ncbi:hypothetical protein [Fusobacterium ulcerans]|uniref:hypothetical protein n=1 Tax=Fusobacterium ulcerans TaxID=861 RepID=UPI00241F2B3B|nr:hypothetical protein [Fusobacterium ulcerans]
MFRVYSKEKISKELFTVNLLQEEVETVLEGNLFLDHPELKEEDCIVIEKDTAVQNPTFDESREEIREMTREEKILLLEEIDLLADGEYLENGEIKEIKYIKELGYYRPTWDKELHIWEEGTTKEEFIEIRKNKILEYSKLEEDKKLLENSKFSTLEEIELIVNKMQILEVEINNIAVVSVGG